MVFTGLIISFPSVSDMDYGYIIETILIALLPCSIHSKITKSVSLSLLIVLQLCRPRQELHLRLDLCQMTNVELL